MKKSLEVKPNCKRFHARLTKKCALDSNTYISQRHCRVNNETRGNHVLRP